MAPTVHCLAQSWHSIAALLAPLQPIEHAPAARDRERGAEYAQIAAIEALDEQTGCQQREREQHEPPLAHEVQQHDGLEGFDFGQLLGKGHVAERDAKDAEE